jgi:hypothetical protein
MTSLVSKSPTPLFQNNDFKKDGKSYSADAPCIVQLCDHIESKIKNESMQCFAVGD